MRRGMRKAECNCGDDGMAHLRHDILSRFRRVRRPDCVKLVRPGGRGECRVPVAPAASCVRVVNTRVSHHGRTGITRHSRTRWF